MKIEKKTLATPTGQTKDYYYDPVKPAEYRRIAGGLGWPSGESPGFIVVVAEDYHKDPTLKFRHLRLLTEYESMDVSRLVKRLYDFQNTYLVNPWYGENENELMIHFVSRFNKALGPKKKGIHITGAPFVEDPHSLRFYANQIKNLMGVAKKALHFGASSQLPGQLGALTPDDVQMKKVQDFPAIAALGFAVAGLDEPYFDVVQVRELQDQMIAGYNVAGL